MSLKLKTILAGTLAFSLPTTATFADDLDRDTIEVTASRIPQNLDTVGSSVSVITQDEIDRYQERFALDALTTTAGLDLARQAGPGGVAGVFLRGADQYQTMVLIDGVQVNDTSATQSAFDFGRLVATDIQRIEVLRGPQSTLYGGDAVGGVINIITKQPTNGVAASGLVEFGSFGAQTYAARLAGGGPDAGGYISVTRYGADGFPAADERFGNHMNDGLISTQASAGGHWSPIDWLALELALRSADSEAGFPNQFGAFGRPADEPNEARTHERLGRLSATTNFFDGAFTGTASFEESLTRRHSLDFTYGETDFNGERRKAEYVASGKVNDWLSLVGGLAWQEDLAHTSYDPAHETTTRAVYGELQLQPIEKFASDGRRSRRRSLDLRGLRDLSCDRGLSYSVDRDLFARRDRTGFRAPSLYELYDTYSGNRALRPETSRGWEAGIDQNIGADAKLTLTWFNQRVDNRIDYAYPAGYFNAGHTRSRGLEIGGDYRPFEALSLRAAYTYDQAETLDTGAPALRRPRHSASLMGDWTVTDALDVTVKLRAVSKRFDVGNAVMSGYGLADIGARYKLPAGFTIEGRIENLTDARYEEVYGYGEAGRAVYGGVTYSY